MSNDSQAQSRRARLHAEKGGVAMHMTRLCLLVAVSLPLAAAGCIERLPPRPPPEVPPYPQEKFDSPLNAWHEYQRAAALRDPAAESPPYPRGPLTPEQAARFHEYLRHQRATSETFDRAIAAPYCVVPQYDFAAPMREFASMRELARLRVAQGRLLAYQGDTAGAVAAWLDAIEMGHDMMQEGVVIARLIGIAIDSMGSRPLVGLVQQGGATTRDYRGIISRLNDLDAQRFPYADTLRREYEGCSEHLFDVWREDNLAPWGKELANRIIRMMEYLRIAATPEVLRSNYDTYFSMLVDDAQRPYPQRDRSLEEAPKDPLLEALVPTFSRLRDREVSDVVRLRAVVLMAALQLYRLDHVLLPPTLDALRPTYLAEVPLDPFSEQPYRYLRLPDDRFVVYSLGPDGDDDRAEVEFEWRNRERTDGDIIFREGAGEP